MNSNDCEKINKELSQKLNRAKGQLTGIENMINTNRDSMEIVTQIQAVRAALSSIAIDILKEESKECLNCKSPEQKEKQFEELVIKFFKIN